MIAAYLISACVLATPVCDQIVVIEKSNNAICQRDRQKHRRPQEWVCLDHIPTIVRDRFRRDRGY